MAGRRLLVGIGNPRRGDDGVGPAVAARLRGHAAHSLEVREHDGEAAALVELLAQADVAYLVDAAVSRSPPGTIHRLDVSGEALPRGLLAVSTHGLGVYEAVELARAIGSLPSRCVVFAVVGANFETGDGSLSPPVERAAVEVAKRILAEPGGTHEPPSMVPSEASSCSGPDKTHR